MRQIGGKYYSRKGLSIKQKVTIWYACMLVLIVLLLFGFILTISRNLLQRESDSRLEKIVLDFIDDIDFESNWYELDDDVRFFEDGVIFSLYDEQGQGSDRQRVNFASYPVRVLSGDFCKLWAKQGKVRTNTDRSLAHRQIFLRISVHCLTGYFLAARKNKAF